MLGTSRCDVHGQRSAPSLPNHPEIAGNDIGDPGDVARQPVNRTGVFLHRHYEQVCFHRLNKIRGRQTSVPADAARFDWDLSRAG